MLVALAMGVRGQTIIGPIRGAHFASTPTGSCGPLNLAIDDTTYAIYVCEAGVWQTASSGGGGSVFPVTVSGTVNSGGIPCFNSATNEESSAALAAGEFILGGGAGACVSASFSVVPVANGGTNAATAPNALISLFPTASEVGDLVYCATYSSGCTSWALLAGNTSGTKVLQETSAGVPSWVAAGSGVTSIATTAPLGGGTITTTGTLTCTTCTTNASALTSNVLVKGAGGQATQNSLFTDTGTTATYTGTGGVAAPAFTSTGTTAGFIDFPQGTTSSAVAPCNTATSICEQAPTAVTSYLVTKPGAAPTVAGSFAATSTAGVQSWQSANEQFCGTTSSCGATPEPNAKFAFGSAPLVSGVPSTVTITGISPAFTATGDYTCTVSAPGSVASTALFGVTNVSASSFTITGPASVSTVIAYICVGF
jgi:hypothetical protein